VANQDEGLNSYKLHRLLRVSQTTAQFMLRRIRLPIQAHEVGRQNMAAQRGDLAL
jgi:hypothetical protein